MFKICPPGPTRCCVTGQQQHLILLLAASGRAVPLPERGTVGLHTTVSEGQHFKIDKLNEKREHRNGQKLVHRLVEFYPTCQPTTLPTAMETYQESKAGGRVRASIKILNASAVVYQFVLIFYEFPKSTDNSASEP